MNLINGHSHVYLQANQTETNISTLVHQKVNTSLVPAWCVPLAFSGRTKIPVSSSSPSSHTCRFYVPRPTNQPTFQTALMFHQIYSIGPLQLRLTIPSSGDSHGFVRFFHSSYYQIQPSFPMFIISMHSLSTTPQFLSNHLWILIYWLNRYCLELC